MEQKVLVFLKRNKEWAYRPCEIVKKLKSNNNAVSGGLRMLLKKGKVDVERICQNCAYYNYKEGK